MKNVGHDGDEERFPLTHVRNDHDGDRFPMDVILRPFDCAQGRHRRSSGAQVEQHVHTLMSEGETAASTNKDWELSLSRVN